MSLSYLFEIGLDEELPLSETDRQLSYACPDCGARLDRVKEAIVAAYREDGAGSIEADLECALRTDDTTGFDSDGYRTTPLCGSGLRRR
jgi:predicted nucleic acid-binding Zn ribbon protein